MSDLELVLLAVDDDRSDLLVHKDEDGAEQSRDEGDDGGPPGVRPHGVYKPATIVSSRLGRAKRKVERKIIW